MRRIIPLLVLVYIASRLYVVNHWPLFFDEAIYVRWATAVYEDWTWKFVSLIDGKQPLFIWLTSFNLYLIQDVFIAGRMVSFISGLINLFAIYWLGKRIFDQKVGLLATFLYLIIPFYQIYDSLALMDTLLLTTALITAVFSILLAEKLRWKYAVVMGIAAGLGLLTKSSAIIYILLIPTSIVFLKSYKKEAIKKYFIFVLISVILAKIIESIMRFSIYYPIIAEKNKVFSYTFDELIKMPISNIMTNFNNIGIWMVSYFGLTVVLGAFSINFVNRNRKIAYLSLNIITSLVIAGILGKQLYPRYILFMTWPIVILAAVFIVQLQAFLKNKWVWWGSILIFLYPVLYNNWYLYTDVFKMKIPEVERWQFLAGGPSGVNIDQVFSFIDSRSNKRILIIADQHNGILSDSIAAKYFRVENVQSTGSDGIDKELLMRKIQDKTPVGVYLLLSWQGLPSDIPADLVKEIKRPGKDNNWKLYQVREEWFTN